MKRLIPLIILAVILFQAAALGEPAPERQLTVMVYMCGSNLESAYGSATADIQEMLEVGVDGSVSLLVMTGGSGSWMMGYDAEEIAISEISARGRRIVWRSDKQNMGSADTLSSLLRFGQEKYPARDYALILWDHGGGPLEGVCWDELFSMDNLSLVELLEGLEQAGLPGKLSWIGFDACLMSSLEVAAALSPYAQYMIASQETEPAFGWNYSFLKGLGQDADGAETGKRIVDAYFEGHETVRDVLTLSCVDLEKAALAVEAMDAFFQPIRDGLGRESFAGISNLRMSATGFGKAVRGISEDGYDLVDALSLIRLLSDKNDAGTVLDSLLSEAVVYSRSNEEGANGLSLYHPYANKDKYLEKWHDSYTSLHFSSGYAGYIDAFGSLLTGDEMVRWGGMVTQDQGFDPQNENLFSLQLTPEQQAGFASAQLLILMESGSDSSLEEDCVLVASCPAEMDENGLVIAAYSGRTLYCEQENGQINGPVSFLLSDDGQYGIVIAVYFPQKGTGTEDRQIVLYYLENDPETDTPEIARIRVWDEATQSFTNRIAFTEENCRSVLLWNLNRVMPQVEEGEALPAFGDWSTDVEYISAYQFPLPDSWRFFYHDEQLSGDRLYAMFQITDVQQNMYCSRPVPVRNSFLRELSVPSGAVETDEYRLELKGHVDSSPLSSQLMLEMKITNLTDTEARYSTDRILLNGHRWTNHMFFETVAPHGSETVCISVSPEELTGLEEVGELSFLLKLRRDTSVYDTEEIPVSFLLENGDVSAVALQAETLGETEQDGIFLRLMSVEPHESGGFEMLLYVRNDRDKAFQPEPAVLLNGIRTSATLSDALPAGCDGVFRFRAFNDLRADSSELKVSGVTEALYDTVLSDRILQRHGFDTLNGIGLILKDPDARNSFWEVILVPLKTPWPLRETDDPGAGLVFWGLLTPPQMADPSETVRCTLSENNQVCVSLEQVFTGEDSVALSLEIVNRTGVPQRLNIGSLMINGLPAKLGPFQDSSFILTPHAVHMMSMTMTYDGDPPEKGSPVTDLAVAFWTDTQDPTDPAHVFLPEGTVFGADGGQWVDPAVLSVTGVMTPDVEEIDETLPARAFEEEISLPSDAVEYRRWVEAPLTPEQASRVSEGLMAVVKEREDGYLQIVTMQYANTAEDSTWGALFTGLVPCIESSPEVYWYSSISWGEDQSANGLLWSETDIQNQYYSNRFTVSKLQYRLDYSLNRALITDYKLEGEAFRYQVDMMLAGVKTMETFPILNDDGGWGYLGEFSIRSDASWFLTTPAVELHGKPLRIALRPPAAQDGLYILFSFQNKDGTGFSLPLIPIE